MSVTTPAPAQKDNLFGICAALGEDFGFNPLYLRVALSAGILWNPLAMFGGYLALGVVVLATRLLVPNPKPAPVEPAGHGAIAAANVDDARLPLAA